MRLFNKHPKLPLLALRDLVVFPRATVRIDVGRPASLAAVEAALARDGRLFLATQRTPEVEAPGPEDLYPHGVVAEIRRSTRMADGTVQLIVEAIERGRLLGLGGKDPVWASYEPLPEGAASAELAPLVAEVKKAFERYLMAHKALRLDRHRVDAILGEADPAALADAIAQEADWQTEEKAALLGEPEPGRRLERVLALLLRDLERLDLDRKIAARVKQQMDQNQREYYLREQMRAIQAELGGGQDLASEVEELRERIEKKGFPEEVKEKALKELARYERLQPGSPEAGVVRTYLDWLLDLPWSEASEEVLDLGRTRAILDRDHHGLEDVKDRILEFLAVQKLAGEDGAKGPILLLVGPPGVGKTSLGRSVAESMNRNFVRVSLGGVRDEAEIRGHRRTYVGALPGKIIQSMKKAGTINPVFLLDEVDKLGADWRGDPASALLEVLDPEQNKAFQDHYLEVPYDLSRVFFIATANTTSSIPRPLLDRMEVIEIPGYTPLEKRAIAIKHLWPKVAKRAGVADKVEIAPEAVDRIIAEYTDEAGVRNLERTLAKVARRLARAYLENPWTGPRSVEPGDLPELLGPPLHRPDRREKAPMLGAATGLAWTETGGRLLVVEALAVPGKGRIRLTGNLGEVMKESAEAAVSYLRAHAGEWGLDPDFFEKFDLHVHVPEGAVPKDGPSAGITVATAVASALSGRPVRPDLAMTGEITLRGRVLPIGGLKEKLLAAYNAGIKEVLIPRENEPQLEEVPEEVRKGLVIRPVASMDEVFQAALLPPAEEPGTARPRPRA